MIKLSKSHFVLASLLAGVPVVLFFQNCGQPGSITSTQMGGVSAKSTTDSFVIVPSKDANDNQVVAIDKPPLSIAENSGEVSSDSSVSSDTSDADSSVKGSIAQCGNLMISDILLKISSISLNCDKPDDIGFEIIDSDKTISLDKLNLKLKALKTEKTKEIFLMLSQDGNKILSTDNQAMDLKTPSAQKSGMKVKLVEEISVVEGKTYNLELSVNPSEQIVSNKDKCIFKPVVREASLTAL